MRLATWAAFFLMAFLASACGGDSTAGGGGGDDEPKCGNAIVEEGEECDLGTANSDAPDAECRTTCKKKSCGDGIKDSNEACDRGPELFDEAGYFIDGNSVNEKASCRPGCLKPGCGDGILDKGEQCDLGPANSDEPDSECRTNCKRPSCGDGIKDKDEECDNGADNANVGDAQCRINCKLRKCGDGILDPLSGEGCDDGDLNSDSGEGCRTDCTLAGCGDGVKTGEEQCDEGDQNSNTTPLACRLSCELPKCGDGVVDNGSAFGETYGEECDNGGLNSDSAGKAGTTCRNNCLKARCGDGVLDEGESCDTGSMDNTAALDGSQGCSANCRVVSGWRCTGSGAGSCIQMVCGDGVKDESERCDDGAEVLDEEGNYVSGNSDKPGAKCRSNCALARCGDGILVEGEECDTGDADTAKLDGSKGCDANCKVVSGWVCEEGKTGPGSCRLVTCGDGITDAGELCDNGAKNSDAAGQWDIEGKVTCRSNCTPARCGDGVVDVVSGEKCDTGSLDHDAERGLDERLGCASDCSEPLEGWTCSDDEKGHSTCHQIVCGDSLIDGDEKCDNGAANTNAPGIVGSTCRAPDAASEFGGCVFARCGDGIVDEGEECDTGSLESTEPLSASSGCTSNCKVASGWACTFDEDGKNVCHEIECGDGIVDMGEACDNEELSDERGTHEVTCRTNCTWSRCGDGVLDYGEECDIGSIASKVVPDGSKGCSGNCMTVPGWVCTNEEDAPCHKIVCGDGIKDEGEACDDGDGNSDVSSGACRTDCRLPRCGDGVIDEGEQCDTGSPKSNVGLDGSKGCDASCRVVSGWVCTEGVGGANSCRKIVCGDGFLDGEDVGGTEVCDKGSGNSNAPGFHDGIDDTCRTNCMLARCGDGVLDDGEKCDTGSLDNIRPLKASTGCDDKCLVVEGWTCSGAGAGSCHTNACGNGIVEAEEQCDNKENNSNAPGVVGTTCRQNCSLARCGDGIVDQGEECDIGNLENFEAFDGSQGCTRRCKIVSGWSCSTNSDGENVCHEVKCGDGIVDQGEECDEGERNGDEPGDTCRSNCTKARCGDGILDSGETCDTGSLSATGAPAASSGCDASCKPVNGWACTVEEGVSVCHEIKCGDGFKDGDEECDEGESNGNTAAASCRTNCKRARCGDGILDEGEQCDTGSIDNASALTGADGCTDQCRVVSGWACLDGQSGAGSCHRIVCGDGYTDGSEECDYGEAGKVVNPSYEDNPRNSDGVGVPGATCRTNCTWARCGDGVVDNGELCDTGSGIDSATTPQESSGCDGTCKVVEGWACTNSDGVNSCHRIACGDGIVDGEELCDDGQVSDEPDADCRTNCMTRRCGDGIVDTANGEECDTGSLDNTEPLSSTSGCKKDCKVAAGWACLIDEDGIDVCHEIDCGDGYKDGSEECDKGEANNDEKGVVGDTCRSNCLLARCGDGILDEGEECDTGTLESTANLDGSRGCDASCRIVDGWACYPRESGPDSCHVIGCGDGIPDVGEECDDGTENGNTSGNSCRTNCTKARCGDGIVSDDEECDTGTLDNTSGLDGSLGCSNKCKVVVGWACLFDETDGEAGPESCHRITCGDGYTDGDEECDFGTPGADILNPVYRDNPKNSDERGKQGVTCRTNCTWSRCGDGVLDQGESCDTGSSIDNDEPLSDSSGCGSDCKVVEDYACLEGESGPGSCHPISCGDGYKDGNEGCDEGGANSNSPDASCRTNCTQKRCGDGIIDEGEECDTGSLTYEDKLDGSEGCTEQCKIATGWACVEGQSGSGSCHPVTCGDGYKDGAEDCDLGSDSVEILNPELIGHPRNSDNPGAECRLNCMEARCGDGIIDSGEKCDTGSYDTAAPPLGSSGCSEDCDVLEGYACLTNDGVNVCHPIICGDGYKDGDEECDDGASNSDTNPGACRTNCKRAYCGDGIKDTGETCDDGLNTGVYKISDDPAQMISAEQANCLNCTGYGPYCGDGLVNGDESCDRGSSNTVAATDRAGYIDSQTRTVCRPNCMSARCGDGILDNGEQCDTGFLANEDELDGSAGCDADCKVVSGWECGDEGYPSSGPGSCHKYGCGDGKLNPGEECDEGASNSMDVGAACRPDCRLPYCGDGVVVEADGEICDDGINTSRYSAYGATPYCLNCTGYGPRCGDGIVNNGEVCDDGVNTLRHGNSYSSRKCKYCTGWGPYCGDGNVSDGEQCDRGSANSNAPNAYCRADCTIHRCGDAIVDTTYGEFCDDGVNDNSYGHCRSDCTALARGCGDGVVEGRETCDEGILNGVSGHCNTTCSGIVASHCGDGVKDSGEACDNGNSNGFGPAATCRMDCTSARCGDGILDGNEECDLGSSQNTGVRCTSSCRRGSSAMTCGDGIQDPGETCDKGNGNANSGTATCSTSCGYRWRNANQDITFNDRLSTRSGTWNRPSSCSTAVSLSGSYRYNAYEVTNVTGSAQTIDVLANQNCDGYVYVFRGSKSALNGNKCVSLNDDFSNTRHSAITGVSIANNETITVVVSSFGSTSSCSSTVRITKSRCGNGIRSSGEGCDDGNTIDGDGCSSSCQPETSYTCTSSCTNGNCHETCAIRMCGNGRLESGEQCDDGNRVNGDGCSSNCAIESNSSCVSSTFTYTKGSFTMSYNGNYCHANTCGDGFVVSPEVCDDGNRTSGDGCDNDCTLSSNGHCFTQSDYITKTISTYLKQQYYQNKSYCDVCGNGKTAMGEQCDTGASVGSGGCNAQCKVNSGYVCSTTQPSYCSAITSGDGVMTSSPNYTITRANGSRGTIYVDLSGYVVTNYGQSATSPYFYSRNGCSTSVCSAYPYKAWVVKNNTSSAKNVILEAKFDSVDGWLEVHSAPFNPATAPSTRLDYNDDGSSACYTSYTGVKHSCLAYTIPAGGTITLVATTYSPRTTGAGYVTVRAYQK